MQQQDQQTARRSASSARRFLRKNAGIALAVTAAAVLGSATSASAGTGLSHRGSVVTDVRTAAAFDYAAGEIPENITVNPPMAR